MIILSTTGLELETKQHDIIGSYFPLPILRFSSTSAFSHDCTAGHHERKMCFLACSSLDVPPYSCIYCLHTIKLSFIHSSSDRTLSWSGSSWIQNQTQKHWVLIKNTSWCFTSIPAFGSMLGFCSCL